MKRLSKVEVSFQNQGNTQGVIEAIATFTSVRNAYTKEITTLNGCHTVNGSSGGHQITGTVGAMSFPSYGRSSEAFVINLKVQGQTYVDYLLMAHVKSVMIGVQDFSSTSPSLKQFEGFVSTAVNDIQGSSSTDGGTSTTTRPLPNSSSTISFKDLSGSPYKVTVAALIDPAQAADQFTTPDPGKRFIGVKIRILNVGSNQITDDANLNATLVGSNGQTYSADFDSIAGCTNFNSGQYQLNPGQSATGCVVFQVPKAVSITDVEWSPDGGLGGGNFGDWTVRSIGASWTFADQVDPRNQ
ncbi:MAG: DUF4352 domain-containing protein [Acidimicrobiales bacterium]